jgi:hypothetical protein
MGGGEAGSMSGTGINGFESSQNWTPIPPNTVVPSGDAFWKFVCEKQ